MLCTVFREGSHERLKSFTDAQRSLGMCVGSCRQAGFTMLEMLIAMMVFAFVLLGSGALLATTIQTNAENLKMGQAIVLAQDQAEFLKSAPYTSTDLNVGTHTDPNNPVTGNGSAGGRYTRTWSVTESNQLKTVAITVAWTTKRPHAMTLTLVKDGI